MPGGVGIMFIVRIYFFLMWLFIWIFLRTILSNRNNFHRSIWTKDGTLIGVTTLSQSGPGNNGNENLLHTP